MSRPVLGNLEFRNWKGVYTKGAEDLLSPTQLRNAENTDFFSIYGAISKVRGNKRLLSSQYNESAVVKPISWVGFYKANDLNGALVRRVLVACGTKIGIYSGGAITIPSDALANTRISGRFHVSAQYGQLMFIQNQDPKLVGNGDTPTKFDGTNFFRWGVEAPGTEETVITGWSVTPSASDTTSVSSTYSLDGAGDVLNKVATGTNVASLKFTGTTFSVSTSGHSRLVVWLYIPRGVLHLLQQNTSGDPAVKVYVNSNGGADFTDYTYVYSFSIGELADGWNALKLDTIDTVTYTTETVKGTRTKPGTNAPNCAAINCMKVEVITAANATTFQNVAIDKITTFQNGTCDRPVGATAGPPNTFNGTYSYRFTFVTKYGLESNAGPASFYSAAITNQQKIQIKNLPISSDPQVIARRVYRTLGGGQGSQWLLVDQIDNNTQTFSVTPWEDTLEDVNIGETTPPLPGDPSFDSSPPPKAGILRIWKDTAFIAGDPLNPDTLFWSEVQEPEIVPLNNQKKLDGPITAMYETYSSLIVETSTGKWQITGDGPDFNFDKVIEGMGTVGPRASGTSKIIGWTVDRDGLRLYDSSASPYQASAYIRDKYDALPKQYIDLTHTVHFRPMNTLLQFLPDGSNLYTNVFQYQYVVDNPQTGYWSFLKLPNGVNILDVEEVEDANGDLHLYAGSSGGMLYELYEPSTKSFYVDANNTPQAITTTFTSPWMRPGEIIQPSIKNAQGRCKPRLVELRAKGDATTWTLTLESSEGQASASPLASRTVQISFSSGQSLKRLAVPADFNPGEYFRYTLTNNDADVSSSILALCIYFIGPDSGQYVVE